VVGLLEIVTSMGHALMAFVNAIKVGLAVIVQLGYVHKIVHPMARAELIFLLLYVIVILDGLVLTVLKYFQTGPVQITVHSMVNVFLVNVTVQQDGKEMIAA